MRRSEKGFTEVFLVVVVALLLVGIGFYAYQRNQNANSTANLPSAPKAAKHPGVVGLVQFSTSVDGAGNPVASTTSFATTDPKIDLVATLKDAKKDTRVEYIRYRNDKFVDNGGITVSKDGAKYASFDFRTKAGKTHPKGTYKVKLYTNGIYERAATYTVK